MININGKIKLIKGIINPRLTLKRVFFGSIIMLVLFSILLTIFLVNNKTSDSPSFLNTFSLLMTGIGIAVFAASLSIIGGILKWLVSLLPQRITNYIRWTNKAGFRVGKILFLLFIAYILINWFLVRPTVISGDSMNGYKDGSRRFACQICSFKRGDVIVHASVVNPATDFLGRVVASPNESVEIGKGYVKINGQTLNEPYADWSKWTDDNVATIKLANDQYLTLLDKRDNKEPFTKGYLIQNRVFTMNLYRGKIL